MLTTLQGSRSPEHDQLPGSAAVVCKGISKSFGDEPAVRNVTLQVDRGSTFALLGPSGGGKTTTLRMIAGFERPDSGSISIEGRTVVGQSEIVPPERRRVGMVFQDYALFPHMTVRQNTSFGVPSGPERDRRVDDVLDLVGLSSVADHMPFQLSGGQQQRVAVARALAPNPSVVLLDEPFSNLDATLRQHVREEIRQILHETNKTAIFVTHDQDEAFGLADTVGIMLDNTLVQVGQPQDVYLYPASIEVANFLGETNVLDGDAAQGMVRCELGHLPIGGSLPSDGRVKVSVRPETIRLHADGPDSVQATVVSVEFRGIYKVITVRLGSGKQLGAVMGLHVPAEVGATVTVGVNSFVAAFIAEPN